jgi:excisionase family DNA binding protein
LNASSFFHGVPMNSITNPQSPSNEEDIPRLAYRIEDAAVALGVGRTLVYRLIHDGQLAVIKIGGRSLITATELDAFLARRGEK